MNSNTLDILIMMFTDFMLNAKQMNDIIIYMNLV